MAEFYPWWVYLHVFGAFAFVFAHGASAIVAFRLRGARDVAEVRTLLDLSQVSIGVMYIGLLLLLVGGIVAGLVGDHFSRGWIWASLVLLIVTIVAMYMLATPYYGRLREAVGARTGDADTPVPDPSMSAQDLAALVGGSRPFLLAGVGLAGFVVILWLMILKPF